MSFSRADGADEPSRFRSWRNKRKDRKAEVSGGNRVRHSVSGPELNKYNQASGSNQKRSTQAGSSSNAKVSARDSVVKDTPRTKEKKRKMGKDYIDKDAAISPEFWDCTKNPEDPVAVPINANYKFPLKLFFFS